MPKIIITADSTFDMPTSMAEENDIKVIPSYVRMGDCTYDDNALDDPNDLFRFYERTKELPQTAAANPEDYLQFFKKYAIDGNVVMHIAKGSSMSSCCSNAMIAAAELENVFVIDSENISGGSALLALAAAQNKDAMQPEALLEWLNAYKEKIIGGFIIEYLEYLQKGGRCSALAVLGANVLKLRPCISITDGKMTVGRKLRGGYEKCLFTYIDEQLSNINEIDKTRLYISHSIQSKDLMNKIIEHIAAKNIFDEIVEWPVGAGVSVHCGPNTFGMFFIHK